MHNIWTYIQGGSNMTGTIVYCLHTNQSRSYLNHLVFLESSTLRIEMNNDVTPTNAQYLLNMMY
jgi:hypothetical protein